jgi:hypothetical protein
MQLKEEEVREKTSRHKSWRLKGGAEKLGFHAYFDILYNLDGRVVSSRRRMRFTPKEIAWYPFLSEAEWIPGLLNVGTWTFQAPYRESNTKHFVLWCSASTNCAIRPPAAFAPPPLQSEIGIHQITPRRVLVLWRNASRCTARESTLLCGLHSAYWSSPEPTVSIAHRYKCFFLALILILSCYPVWALPIRSPSLTVSWLKSRIHFVSLTSLLHAPTRPFNFFRSP